MKKLLAASMVLAAILAPLFAQMPPAVNVPQLVYASRKQSHVTLRWVHETAQNFSLRIRWQDAGISISTTSVIARMPAHYNEKGGYWETSKPKILGDTNFFSVSVVGTTNWSNEICVIP